MKNIKFEEVQSLLDSGKQPEEIFDWISFEVEGFRVVGLNRKQNYLDENNKLLSDTWFDYCERFYNGLGKVGVNYSFNYIKPDGTLLSPNQWFDFCNSFYNGFGKVRIGNETHYINQNGKLLHKKQVKR